MTLKQLGKAIKAVLTGNGLPNSNDPAFALDMVDTPITKPITAKEINKRRAAAVKMFGEYNYHDKGASGVMGNENVEAIVEALYNIENTNEIVAIIKELDKKDINKPLLDEIVMMLIENYEEDFADELAECGGELITKYY